MKRFAIFSISFYDHEPHASIVEAASYEEALLIALGVENITLEEIIKDFPHQYLSESIKTFAFNMDAMVEAIEI